MTPESKLKRALKDLLNERGAYWCAVAEGAYAKPGDPDIIVCYKGTFIGIEAKTYNGSQSQWQKLRERMITEAGGIYLIVKSLEDVIEVLDTIDSYE